MLHRRWLAGCSCMARAYEPVKMHYMYYQRSLQLMSFHISTFRVFTTNPSCSVTTCIRNAELCHQEALFQARGILGSLSWYLYGVERTDVIASLPHCNSFCLIASTVNQLCGFARLPCSFLHTNGLYLPRAAQALARWVQLHRSGL